MRTGNIIFSSLLLALMFGVLYMTLQMPAAVNRDQIGPSYVPMVYVCAAIVLCIGIIIQSVKEKTKEPFHFDKRFFLYVFIAVIYLITIHFIGYYLSTVLSLVVLFLMLGVRKWYVLISVPSGFCLFIYIVFDRLVNLPIP